jgi:ABC-type transporter Mla subunit MlaD
MATRANYVKLGIFVIVGLVAVLGLAVGLGAVASHHDTVPMVTYFNESVQGLDVGAPVTFRGVRLGTVGSIMIAPDQKMVEVRSNLDVGALQRLGYVPKTGFTLWSDLPPPPPDLRTQLGSQGFTGMRFVALDYFDPKTNPPLALSFPPGKNYVPSAKSFTFGLEDAITRAMERVIELSDIAVVAVRRADVILADLEQRNVGEKAAKTLVLAQGAISEFQRTVHGLDHAKLGDNADATLDSLRTLIGQLGRAIDHVDGADGLFAVATRSVATLGEVGRNVNGSSRALESTLSEIREAATAIRLLADELDRQPDALLKGRGGEVSR